MVASAFKVIVSTQEEYSVWPAEAEAPLGWDVGELTDAPLAKCLAYIGEVWEQEAPDEVLNDEEAFVVIIDDHDILSLALAGPELPEEWQTATEAVTLREALAFIEQAWQGAGPLPERFRPDTGESPPDAMAT